MDFSAELEIESEDTKKVVYQQMSQEVMDRIAELRREMSSHVTPCPETERNRKRHQQLTL
jgi:hypothetical protein